MNSIRPLITITILVVVGAFLYVKINQGPVRSAPGASGDAWPNPSPEGVPPLAATSGTGVQGDSPAPPWSASPPAAEVLSEAAVSGVADLSAQQPPAVPAIPEIPNVTPPSQPAATATSSIPLPTELPANIPTAQYPDQATPTGTAPSAEVAVSAAPPIASSPPAAEAVNQPTPTPQPTPMTPEQANNIDIATNNLSSPPLAAQQNPLPQSPIPLGDDRYGTGANLTEPSQTKTTSADAVPTSFATSWPAIQAALDQGELARAHELLSQWYNDPALTPTDAELVDTLLAQLAGTVIYSTEHQLEPAYVVKPGETLETIAQQYNVPWQLLAKINGIPAADQVQPGQELKVVRGPFSAVVDLDRKQLTLMVGDRYAGKFPVTVPSAAAVSEGRWTVGEKLIVPSTTVAQSAYTPGPAAVDRAIVLRGETTVGQAAAGETLTIGSGGAPASPTAGPPAIRISPQDAEELSDILSVGSRVVIRR